MGYGDLVDELLRHVDPTTLNRQRQDVGKLYRSGIYYHNENQKKIASKKLETVQKAIDQGAFRETEEKSVVMELKPATDFYIAEDIHQRFLENGGR